MVFIFTLLEVTHVVLYTNFALNPKGANVLSGQFLRVEMCQKKFFFELPSKQQGFSFHICTTFYRKMVNSAKKNLSQK